MSKMRNWALFYALEVEWSVIPINPKGKKPLVKWKGFINNAATEEEINMWWEQWPMANIGVVTGLVSNISVLDIDEHEVPGTLEYVKELYLEHFPGDPSPPWEHTIMSRTGNGGYHWVFKYREDLVSRRVIPAVDCKSDGGYIIVPPSEINGRKYRWIRPPYNREDKSVFYPPPFPHTYHSLFSDVNPFTNTEGGDSVTPKQERIDSVGDKPESRSFVSFEKGNRDNSLFHIAFSLTKGGTASEDVRYILNLLADGCDPPFKNVQEKVDSALQRAENSMVSMVEAIRNWIDMVEGTFSYDQLDRELGIKTQKEKANRRQVMARLKDEKIVEPVSGKAGHFRKVDSVMLPLDFVNVQDSDEYEGFRFPFGEERLFKLMPKNIVIVTAAPDVGKTAYMLNLAKENMNDFNINFYSSEMGDLEFHNRLQNFGDVSMEDWNFKAFERSNNFHDVIDPNAVSIIDYLEMHDNFYEIGRFIKQIFDKLENGVAFIAIQKNIGNPNPLGGQRAREKARLVLNLEPSESGTGNIAKITKAKNWRTYENPSGLEKYYHLHGGCQFSADEEWTREYE